jgi:hypothetical protein
MTSHTRRTPDRQFLTMADSVRGAGVRAHVVRIYTRAVLNGHWTILGLIAAFGILVLGCNDYADLPRSTQTVDGMSVYLGVMPAELVQGHSTVPGDPKALHGGTPQKSSSHHIVVALFDAQTGARITDARIRAGVGDRSYNHEGHLFEPMKSTHDELRQFLPTQGAGAWRIHLEILRAGASRPIEADFAYEHVIRPVRHLPSYPPHGPPCEQHEETSHAHDHSGTDGTNRLPTVSRYVFSAL